MAEKRLARLTALRHRERQRPRRKRGEPRVTAEDAEKRRAQLEAMNPGSRYAVVAL